MKSRKFRSVIYYAEHVERVWKALTDPAELAQWLTRGEFRLKRGHRFEWKAPIGSDDPILDGAMCEVEDIQVPHRLQYRLTHASNHESVISWSLESCGDGTQLIIEHELTIDSGLSIHPTTTSISSYRLERALLRLHSDFDVAHEHSTERTEFVVMEVA